MYLKYLKYVIRHKYFVARACFKFGLYRRGILHDLSKLRLDEFIPYAKHFYGKPKTTEIMFWYKNYQRAWKLHQNRNDHHYQNWVLVNDDGIENWLPMSDDAILEMLCDWWGAGRALDSTLTVKEWYENTKAAKRISASTQEKVEKWLENPFFS